MVVAVEMVSQAGSPTLWACADSAIRAYVLRMLGGARSISGFACVALMSALSAGDSFDMLVVDGFFLLIGVC